MNNEKWKQAKFESIYVFSHTIAQQSCSQVPTTVDCNFYVKNVKIVFQYHRRICMYTHGL